MISTDYLIIGGGIAGTSAAETVRQRNPESSVAIVGAEPYCLYSRVYLPKLIKGLAATDKIILRSENNYQINGIKVYLGAKVQNVDFSRKIVSADSGDAFSYQKLLIAAGGRPKEWRFDKESRKNFFRLQTLDDAQKIMNFFKERKSGYGLVVGGGFVALEFIEILRENNYKTALIFNAKAFWPEWLDEDGFKILSDLWKDRGIAVFGDDEIISARAEKDGVSLESKKGENFAADFVGVGIGLTPNVDFAGELSSPDGIEVNGYLQTSFPDVWAAGDAVFYPDFYSGRMRRSRNWSEACLQGKVAGTNMAGGREIFKHIPICSISHFGRVFTFIGEPLGSAEVKEGFKNFNNMTKEYVRVFERSGIAAGAVLIDAPKFISPITQAIMNRQPLVF